MILADRIVELRKKKGWSQEALGEKDSTAGRLTPGAGAGTMAGKEEILDERH